VRMVRDAGKRGQCLLQRKGAYWRCRIRRWIRYVPVRRLCRLCQDLGETQGGVAQFWVDAIILMVCCVANAESGSQIEIEKLHLGGCVVRTNIDRWDPARLRAPVQRLRWIAVRRRWHHYS